jgi:hypothetical protein
MQRATYSFRQMYSCIISGPGGDQSGQAEQVGPFGP